MSTRQTWMWEGQRAFRNLAQADARELFRQLDAKLDPRIALIGVRIDDEWELPDVCVEPAASEYLVEHLAGLGQAEHEASAAPEGFGLNLGFAVRHPAHAPQATLRRTIATRLARLEESHDLVSFCALPQQVGAYLVCTVLQLDRQSYASHGTPTAAGFARADGLFDSLLDAALDEFLAECSFTLTRAERERFGATSREMPELLRAAGKRLMHGPGALMHGMTDLYDICNMISTMRYEGAESLGGMLVVPPDREGVQVELALGQPVSLRDYRTVRKLLEITGDGALLLCSDGDVYGLGAPVDEGRERPFGFFHIAFTGHYTWRLSRAERVLMEVSYGEPRLPKERIDYLEFRRHVERTFAEIGTADIGRLWGLVSAAAQQRHGTMVVVSSGAESEAVRLGRQGISIEPMALTPRLMQLVTAIDGAVLIDPHNVCHAIGTILDGRATEGGDPSRGARFNSAVRYVHSSDRPCLAIVVSEDGMIDLVSNGEGDARDRPGHPRRAPGS